MAHNKLIGSEFPEHNLYIPDLDPYVAGLSNLKSKRIIINSLEIQALMNSFGLQPNFPKTWFAGLKPLSETRMVRERGAASYVLEFVAQVKMDGVSRGRHEMLSEAESLYPHPSPARRSRPSHLHIGRNTLVRDIFLVHISPAIGKALQQAKQLKLKRNTV